MLQWAVLSFNSWAGLQYLVLQYNRTDNSQPKFHICICRPLNRILVAQSIAAPQMYIAAGLLPVHTALAWLVVLRWRWGLTAAACVDAATLSLTIILTSAYICWAGLQPHTWGRPSLQALQVHPSSPAK